MVLKFGSIAACKRLFVCVYAFFVAPFFLGAAQAQQTLSIVTSFPKDLTEVYKKAFEAKNPGVTVEILSRGTSAAIAYVREAPAGNKPDIFWASAPDAFEVLSSEKLLQKFDGANKEVPAKIGSYPINDPQGYYYGHPALPE